MKTLKKRLKELELIKVNLERDIYAVNTVIAELKNSLRFKMEILMNVIRSKN